MPGVDPDLDEGAFEAAGRAGQYCACDLRQPRWAGALARSAALC